MMMREEIKRMCNRVNVNSECEGCKCNVVKILENGVNELDLWEINLLRIYEEKVIVMLDEMISNCECEVLDGSKEKVITAFYVLFNGLKEQYEDVESNYIGVIDREMSSDEIDELKELNIEQLVMLDEMCVMRDGKMCCDCSNCESEECAGCYNDMLECIKY